MHVKFVVKQEKLHHPIGMAGGHLVTLRKGDSDVKALHVSQRRKCTLALNL